MIQFLEVIFTHFHYAIKKRCGDDYPVLIRYSLTSKTKDFSKGIIPQDTESVEIGKTGVHLGN